MADFLGLNKSKTDKPKPIKSSDPAEAQAAINRERRRAGGSYSQTILGSGLKTSLGA